MKPDAMSRSACSSKTSVLACRPNSAIVAPRPKSWALEIWPAMLPLASTRNASAGTSSTAASLVRTFQCRGDSSEPPPDRAGPPGPAGRRGGGGVSSRRSSRCSAAAGGRLSVTVAAVAPPRRPGWSPRGRPIGAPPGDIGAAGCSAGSLSTSSRDLPTCRRGSLRLLLGHYRATGHRAVNAGGYTSALRGRSVTLRRRRIGVSRDEVAFPGLVSPRVTIEGPASMIVRRRRIALLLASTLALATACSGGDDQAPVAGASGQELKIGLLTPLKGANQGAGEEAQRGAQLAADVINGLNPSIPLRLAPQAGLSNLGGAKVTIVTEDGTPSDTRGAQVVAGEAVNRLVSVQGVDALIGAYDPQVTEYASQRSERYEVPFVNADSPATFLTDSGRDWFFRIGPSWRSAGEAFFSLLREKKAAAGKLVVLHAADKAGQDVVTTVRRLSAEGSLGEVEAFPFAPDARDLQDVVSRVQAAKPDTIFLYVTPRTILPLVTAFATRQYKPKAAISFALGYLTAADFNENPGPVDGLLRSVSWSIESANRNPAAQAVMGLYQRRYNTPMTEAAASAFTAVMTVATAANDAGTTDNQRLRSALLSLDVAGEETIMPWAGIQFDETHQNVLAQGMVEQYSKKAFRVVYPVEASEASLVYPAPNYYSTGSTG